MRASVILGHPDREKKSFNHALARTAVVVLERAGYEVFYHDLYAEDFNPVMETWEIPKAAAIDEKTKVYCDELAASDVIVVVHPNWWNQPPAVLKGWLDRAVRPGVAYDFGGDQGVRGLLTAKAAVVLTTSNTEDAVERDLYGDPLDGLWRKCVFEFCGVPKVIRKNFSVVVTSTPETRARWLEEAGALVGGAAAEIK